MSLDEYWNKFLLKTGREEGTLCSGDLSFDCGLNGEYKTLSILSGQKTAFFTCLNTLLIDNEILPATGELYLVVNRGGEPSCVIEIEKVSVLPFSEVTFDMINKEGEAESIDAWREKEKEELEEEGESVGFCFTPDIKLVYQEFRVIYK